MSVKHYSVGAILGASVLLTGCVSDYKRPYYACYFGDEYEEKCAVTEVGEDRKLVCINVTQDTQFELQNCDAHIKDKKYLFF